MDNQRRYARFLTELDLILSEPGGAVIDPRAQAHDISAAGFRAETRVPLAEGQRLAFEIILDGGSRVRGLAEVIWISQDPWGAYVSGAKITKISWRDSGKLRRQVYRPGYDFAGLARKMFWGFYWIIVVAAIQNIVLHQPLTLRLIWNLLPVIAALAVLGWSLLALLR